MGNRGQTIITLLTSAPRPTPTHLRISTMPRRPRLSLAAMPFHLIQRGNNRGACFFAESDYIFYLTELKAACQAHRVSLHAYCLMTDHVHLLLTPEEAD